MHTAPMSLGTGPATDAQLGQLLTSRETAGYLRISTRTLYTLTASGQLPAIRIGRAVRYRPADLAAYIERLAQGGAT